MEKRYVSAVLAEHEGNRSAAAKAMGIARATLVRKIRTLGI
jgi:transcriptional regulator with PAS, ATPase and Fis domain